MTLFPVPRLSDGALLALNGRTARYGLSLTSAQAAMLNRREQEALAHTERICFGASALPMLAQAFADSPYVLPEDWAQILGALTLLFYELKDATGDRLGDEELAQAMAQAFNGRAQGDLTAMTDAILAPEDAPQIDEEDDDAD
ncbi:MAG: DUF6323 family protein [Candidatus Ventricola sp.]